MFNNRGNQVKSSFVPDNLGDASIGEIEELILWLNGIIEKNDLRRHPRKPLNLKGKFVSKKKNTFPDHSEDQVIIKDVSSKGAGFLSNRMIKIGEPCRVRFSLDQKDLTLSLRVVRQDANDRGFSYGCELLSLEKSAKKGA